MSEKQFLDRRALLMGTAASLLVLTGKSHSRTIRGALPWASGEAYPPARQLPGQLLFFTPDEARTVDALVDRLIPSDENGPGAKESGCTTFIDRQLAGPYGNSDNLYMRPPFRNGTPQQGMQSDITPAARYRKSLSALKDHVLKNSKVKSLLDLNATEMDQLLTGLENGNIQLDGTDSKAFFALLLKDTREGFFSDPIYGGNRNMASWRMIGFPGSRYDLRDWVSRHNEKYPLGPAGISAN